MEINEQTVEQLISSIRQFQQIEFDPGFIRKNGLRFDRKKFKKRIQQIIERLLSESQ